MGLRGMPPRTLPGRCLRRLHSRQSRAFSASITVLSYQLISAAPPLGWLVIFVKTIATKWCVFSYVSYINVEHAACSTLI